MKMLVPEQHFLHHYDKDVLQQELFLRLDYSRWPMPLLWPLCHNIAQFDMKASHLRQVCQEDPFQHSLAVGYSKYRPLLYRQAATIKMVVKRLLYEHKEEPLQGQYLLVHPSYLVKTKWKHRLLLLN